jgi:hypothetical protein
VAELPIPELEHRRDGRSSRFGSSQQAGVAVSRRSIPGVT